MDQQCRIEGGKVIDRLYRQFVDNRIECLV